MALLTIENQYLEQLRKAKEEEKLSFFIGSGFSTSKDPAKYGGWKSIIDSLKKDLSKELQEEQDYLRIAQIYESTKGRKQLLTVVKNAFPEIDEVDELHETLIKCNIQNIITTNWDCLIETAAKKNLAIYDTIATDSELLKSAHQNKIVKIHGDFLHKNIIFSEQDYLNYSDFDVRKFVKDIESCDVDSFMTRLQSIIASLPYPTDAKNQTVEMLEYNFQVAVYLTFTLMGQFTQCEVHSIKGRADAIVETQDTVYIFEFKTNDSAENALAQIDELCYAEKYNSSSKKIVKIGAEFNTQERKLV